MTPRSLQTVLRTLAGSPTASDADLLARFAAGDADAFADLVRRHGRLVWSACRSLTRSEAEADDAFQATFVVLLTSARKVRDPARLSCWLHGAAYRVCANARKATARRAARERAAAVPEANGHPVSGSAWDRALAAVHEAVPGLPEPLRVPFVLCCLEGMTPSEAARQLGWKTGTVDSRLSRAKDAVLARLETRGLMVGAVAGVGLLTPPSTAVATAAALAHAGTVLPASLLTLSHGVVGMSLNPVKILAAALMVACGVGGTVGTGWMASAGAQQPGGSTPPAPSSPATRADPEAELKALRARVADLQAKMAATANSQYRLALGEFVAHADAAAAAAPPKPGQQVVGWFDTVRKFKTARNEYALVPANGLDAAMLQNLVTAHEAHGWEFAGIAPLGEGLACVFRKATTPVVANANSAAPRSYGGRMLDSQFVPTPAPSSAAAPTMAVPPNADVSPAPAMTPTPASTPAASAPPTFTGTSPAAGPGFRGMTAEGTSMSGMMAQALGRGMLSSPQSAAEAERLQAEINVLQAKLAKLRGIPPQVVFTQVSTGLDPSGLAQVLTDLGEKKFDPTGPSLHINMSGRDVTVSGSKEAVEWATGVVKLLTGSH